MNYAIADGFNNPDDLVPFVLQPKQPKGIHYPERVWGGDQSSGFLGTATTTLLWTNTITREAQGELLEQAGLSIEFGSEVSSNEVTLRLQDNHGGRYTSWIVVNATIHAPDETERFYIGWNKLECLVMIHSLVA